MSGSPCLGAPLTGAVLIGQVQMVDTGHGHMDEHAHMQMEQQAQMEAHAQLEQQHGLLEQQRAQLDQHSQMEQHGLLEHQQAQLEQQQAQMEQHAQVEQQHAHGISEIIQVRLRSARQGAETARPTARGVRRATLVDMPRLPLLVLLAATPTPSSMAAPCTALRLPG